MSDRGSILISTANDIGEALVEKLGGEGYAPAVWDKEYNKLGIAEVDSAPALSVLEDSSETGTARGSILLSTANAIGAMLNKKYNTDRGFKPKEWASAGRKMKALETDTKSGSIVNIQGAKETPLLSLVGTIDPTIEGTDELTMLKAGKNLWEFGDVSLTSTQGYVMKYFENPLPAGTYTVSADIVSTTTICQIRFRKEDGSAILQIALTANIGRNSATFTLPETAYRAYVYSGTQQPGPVTEWKDVLLEVGSSQSSFVAYTAPTEYTADLGETVHGGNVDFINGVGKKTYAKVDLGSLTWVKVTSNVEAPYFSTTEAISPLYNYQNGNPNVIGNNGYTYAPIGSTGTSDGFYIITSSYVRIRDANYSSMTAQEFKTAIAGTYLVYERVTPEDFTFDGQEINTSGDVENYYTSAGDTSIEYYTVPTPYTRGTASGVIANVQSARTDLPFTQVKANIAPNLTGVESVEVNKCGVNLFDKTAITPNTWIIVNSTDTESAVGYKTSGYIPVKANTRYYVSAKGSNRTAYYDRNKNGIAYFAFSGGAAFTCLYDGYIRLTIKDDVDLDTFIANEGNEAIAYEPYKGTTYTADLGEPVYGGYADLVSGEVVKDCTKGSMSSTYLSGLNSDYIGYEASTAYFNNHPSIWVRNWNYQTAAPRVSGGIKCVCYEFPVSMHNTTIFSAQYRIYFDVYGKNITSVQDFIDYVEDLEQNGKSLDITYEVATPTESSITPQVISPSEGVNNLWNNAGGDTDVEYFIQE